MLQTRENSDAVNKFLAKQNLPELTWKEIENVSDPITFKNKVNETWVVLGFAKEFHQTLEEQTIPVLLRLFRGEKRGNSPVHLMRPAECKLKNKSAREDHKNEKQLRCPSKGEQIDKLEYRPMLEYLTTVRMNHRSTGQHCSISKYNVKQQLKKKGST